jgi:hypothetical protein
MLCIVDRPVNHKVHVKRDPMSTFVNGFRFLTGIPIAGQIQGFMVARAAFHPRSFILWLALLGLPSLAHAQSKVIGPTKCVGCHDHEKQAIEWKTTEPGKLGPKAHFNTKKQLDAPKSAGFAKAIGIADPYDLKGSCVKCHATVYAGDANAGVSCESCHGGASAWNDIHQQKGAYAQAVAAGMRDLKGKVPAIVKVCVECHVTTDKALVAAGHPVGDKFDVGASLQKIVHWTTSYDFAAVSAAGRTAIAARGAGGGGAKAPPPPSGGAAGGAKPPAPAGGAAKPAAPGGKPGGAPAGGAPAEKPGETAPSAPPAPWDWDQPVRELPKDYVPDTTAETSAGGAGGGAPSGGGTRRPRKSKPAPEPQLSLAEDSPLPPPVPGGEGGALEPAVTPAEKKSADAKPADGKSSTSKSTATPAPPARAGAEDVRVRTVGLIDRLLRSGAYKPNLPAPSKPKEFHGPDSELTRIEDEALALAVEALRQQPPAAAQPSPAPEAPK